MNAPSCPIGPMRERHFALPLHRIAFLFVLLLGGAPPAHAAWSSAPAPVVVASDSLGAIAVCRDADYGAYVAWQEGPTSAGTLRMTHLLGSGDIDAAWPAGGSLVCPVSVNRAQVGLVPDGRGGAYAWWLEGFNPVGLYVRHMLADGTADLRWPARGKFLGSMFGGWRPSTLEDGMGGIFLAWSSYPAFDGTLDVNNVIVSRLGPNGANQTGWLSQNRVITLPYGLHYPPALARTRDGGVFCAFATWSEDSVSLDHGFYLARLAANGTFAPGFAADGRKIAPLVPQSLTRRDLQLTHIAPDSSDGVYLSMLQPDDPLVTNTFPPSLTLLVQHRTATGALADGWDENGLTLGSYPQDASAPAVSRAAQIAADGAGRAYVAQPFLGTDAPRTVLVRRVGPSPVVSGTDLFGYLENFQLVPDGDSGADVASSLPCWQLFAFGLSAPPAVVLRSQTPGDGDPRGITLQGPDVAGSCRYGAAAIAPTGDGDAIGVFVQTSEVSGVFAYRINAAGQLVGVPPVTVAGRAAIGLVRFAAGAGLRVRLVMPAGGAARLDAFDTQGRRVASRLVAATGAETEVTLGEAREWPSGIYHLRLSRGDVIATSRALVVR